MLTLFYSPGACSLSVHIVLEMIGQPYNLQKADRSSPQFLQINPAGAVPALILDDGKTTLTQCQAILNYLAKLNPQLNLINTQNLELAAQQDRWGCFLTGDLHPAFFPIYFPTRYIVNPTDDETGRVKQASKVLVTKKLAIIDEAMQNTNFIVADQLSIPDVYMIPMLRWAKSLLDNGLNDYPNLLKHYNTLVQMPAVVAAMQQEGITA